MGEKVGFGLQVEKGGKVFKDDGGGVVATTALPKRRELSDEEWIAGVRRADRAILGRAISMVESRSARHRELSRRTLDAIMPYTGRSVRVGISGVPGAGKSTFIERLGSVLTSRGHKVAVLAVDPSSSITGGSILGDKTRMTRLSVDPNAFIRPSPSAGTLGGVAQRTRETLLLCEAAGFDILLIETVGVGQSETVVSEMVDFFLALMIPGAGDELQGMKRGLLEVVDLIAINKADGDNVPAAKRAARDYQNAMRCMARRVEDWDTPVLCCSAYTGDGIDELWSTVVDRVSALREDGRLAQRRQEQLLRWLDAAIEEELLARFRANTAVRERRPLLEADIRGGTLAPTVAAERLVACLDDPA